MTQYQQKREEGFTIIEVLIVLAIAGLIMLVVFLAVPALQRTSRNTQRKNDVSQVLGAFSDATSNANGGLPATCNGGTAACWTNNAKLGYYEQSNVNWTKQTSITKPTDLAAGSRDNIAIYSGTKCNATNDGFDATQASVRSIAAEYYIESPSGTNGFKLVCQES